MIKFSAARCVFFIALFLFLTGCTFNIPPDLSTPTRLFVAQPTITPSQNLTLIKTPTNTPAIKPSSSATRTSLSALTPKPSATSTSTPVPTYYPATLSLDDVGIYKLRKWSSDDADYMVTYFASYLAAIENEYDAFGVYGGWRFMDQFRYLVSVESEALLRFPDSIQAKHWKWDLCYNLGISYVVPAIATEAPELECYANLFEIGLNTHETNIADFPGWLSGHEPRFRKVEIKPFKVPAGYKSGYIIEVYDMFWWVLEADGVFQVEGLVSNFVYFREAGISMEYLELTGDDFPELVLHFYISYSTGFFTSYMIYDISAGKPRSLSFMDTNGVFSSLSGDNDSYLTSVDTSDGVSGLYFERFHQDRLNSLCQIKEIGKYIWNGQVFEQVDKWYSIKPPFKESKLCLYTIEVAVGPDEMDVVIQVLEKYNGFNEQVESYFDEIRYRLGEYYARKGNLKKAQAFFTDVIIYSEFISQPSSWVQAARSFLKNLDRGVDYYSTCLQIKLCDKQVALKNMIERSSPEQFPFIVETLIEKGISVQSSGYFDFDRIGPVEQWIVIRNSENGHREFWILAYSPQKIYGFFIAEMAMSQPDIKIYYGFGEEIPAITLNNEVLFSLNWLSLTKQPFVRLLEPMDIGYINEMSLVQNTMTDLSTNLMQGADPKDINETLNNLQNITGFNCDENLVCDQFFYLLGLANELLNNEQAALDFYLLVWKNYPDSPYAVMVRTKLNPRP